MRNSRMYILASLCTAGMILLCGEASLFAESVFLKDGSIIEGKVLKETDTTLTIQGKDNKTQVIQRSRVSRTLMNEDYKQKMFIHKMDDTVLEGYIVDETADDYTVRKNLNDAQEITVKKSEVNGVLKDTRGLSAAGEPLKKKSTGLAVLSCILPVWSGSFVTGFHTMGLFFVLFKSTTAALTIYAGIHFFVQSEYSTTYRSTYYYATGNYDDNQDEVNNYVFGILSVAFGVATYIGFMGGDMGYTAKNVKHYNRKIQLEATGAELEVNFDMQPRMAMVEGRFGPTWQTDGMNFAAVCRF